MRRIIASGITTLSLLIILVGCGNRLSGEKDSSDVSNTRIVKFSLNKIDNSSFSLTVEGSRWRQSATSTALGLLNMDSLRCRRHVYTNGTRVSFGGEVVVNPNYFNVEKDETKIVASIKDDSVISGYAYTNLSGKLSITPESINSFMDTAGKSNPIIDSTVYIVENGKGEIRF